MKRFRTIGIKLCGLLASTALFVGITSSVPICFFAFHQPKMPLGMSKYMERK